MLEMMPEPPPPPVDINQTLVGQIARFFYDPVGFVEYVFDWGVGELEGQTGPDTWQRDILEQYGEELRRTERDGGSIKIAVASGHGIGKSALIAWLILFFMSTRQDCRIVVTANTGTQLDTKTWPELALWWKRSINKDWFVYSAKKFYFREDPETWFANPITWSADRSEAFAGTHSKYMLYLFDEGSTIADIIWEVSEGAMTMPGNGWIVFGNPTLNTGQFRECFRKYKHRWITRQIDSRTAKMADNVSINELIEDHGEDSDRVRIRVLGQFPRASSHQFISSQIVEDSVANTLPQQAYEHAPRILGVDVARFGDDSTVFARRQGSKLHPLEKQAGWDTMQTARRVVAIIEEWRPHIVCVDGIGVGSGVVDYLKHLQYNVVDVIASQKALDSKTYLNLRCEMWGDMKKWLETADIPDDRQLQEELTSPEYTFNANLQLCLEKKEDMKKRGLSSPDAADAVAMTFANPAEIAHFYDADNDDDEWDDHLEGKNMVTGY